MNIDYRLLQLYFLDRLATLFSVNKNKIKESGV